MTKRILTLAALMILSFSVFGQSSKEYTNILKQYFKITATDKVYTNVVNQMFDANIKQIPSIGKEVWNELREEFIKTSLDDLAEMLTPIYSKYLTVDDIKSMIAFFKTPVGKKYAKNTPLIMQESMAIGQEWGQKIGRDLIKKMTEKGYSK